MMDKGLTLGTIGSWYTLCRELAYGHDDSRGTRSMCVACHPVPQFVQRSVLPNSFAMHLLCTDYLRTINR